MKLSKYILVGLHFNLWW